MAEESVAQERVRAQVRTLTFDLSERAAGTAGIPVVVSSDAVVDMPDGPEILLHTPDAIDLQRAPLPIIATHRGGQINVGIVDDLHVTGGQLRGLATFGSRPEAVGYREDVENKIIRSVSVGYARNKGKVRSDGVLVTTNWMPFHVAMVGEPADVNAGFFRALETEKLELEVEEEKIASPPDPTTNNDQEAAQAAFFSGSEPAQAGESAVRDATKPPAPVAIQTGAFRMSAENTGAATANAAVENDGVQVERLRIRTIHDLCRQHKVDDKTRDEWVNTGVTADVAASRILDVIAERGRNQPEQAARIGLSNKEVRNYSVHRAISSILGHGNWDKAGLEFEAHKAIRDRLNKDCGKNSFYVPVEVQERAVASHEKRDLTVASASGGGYLVETSNQGFIDILRNRSIVMAMGARRLTGLQGNLTVPKQSGAATAYWLSSESTSITEGALTFGQLSLSPKNVGAYVEISRQLLLQSSPSAEQVTMTDLAAQLGLAVDTAGLNGSGSSGQPTGILNTSGIGSSASGTSIDFANMLLMQSDVAGANALTASCGYATTPGVAALLMARVKFANTATPLWDGNMLDANACGFRGMSSNQVPSATMIFGDWQQMIVAEWGVLEVEVNPVANFQAGIVGVRAIYSVDIGIRHASAFSKVASIT